MEVEVIGPTDVGFSWKSSTEAGLDIGSFSIDGIVQDTISGEAGWTRESFTVPVGAHTVRWEYAKNAAGSAGQDAIWVDAVTAPSIGEAVDNSELVFGNHSAIPWRWVDDPARPTGDMALLPSAVTTATSELTTTVEGPGAVFFKSQWGSFGSGNHLWWEIDGDSQGYTIALGQRAARPSLTYWNHGFFGEGSHEVVWGGRPDPDDPMYLDEVRYVDFGDALDTDVAITYSSARGSVGTTHGWQVASPDESPDGEDCLALETLDTTPVDWVRMGVGGPGVVHFDWQAQQDFDFLVNDVVEASHPNTYDSVAGEYDVVSEAVAFGGGDNDLTWEARGDSYDPSRLDRVKLLTVPDGIDCQDVAFKTASATDWIMEETVDGHDGDVVRSRATAHGAQNSLETTLTEGDLSFWWRVSSEEDYDFLRLYLDDKLLHEISGGQDIWKEISLEIPPGEHRVRWTYEKDGTVSSGEDCGFLDRMTYVPKPITTVTVSPGANAAGWHVLSACHLPYVQRSRRFVLSVGRHGQRVDDLHVSVPGPSGDSRTALLLRGLRRTDRACRAPDVQSRYCGSEHSYGVEFEPHPLWVEYGADDRRRNRRGSR